MATGICLHDLALIAEMINQEASLIRCMRDGGEAPKPEAEARSFAAGIAQINLLIPILQMAALGASSDRRWYRQTNAVNSPADGSCPPRCLPSI